MDFKNQADDFIGIHKRKDSKEGQLQNHSGDPCGRDADGEQAYDFQYRTEDRVTCSTVAAVHNIVAGSDGSGSQIDQQHVLPVFHSLGTQAEQGQQRTLEQTADGDDTEGDGWHQNCKTFDVLVSFHMPSGTHFPSNHHGAGISKTAEKCKYKALQNPESRHGGNGSFRLTADDNIDQHLTDAVE